MKRALIILTTTFPYGTGEAFLESEVPFLRKDNNTSVFFVPREHFQPSSKSRTIPNGMQALLTEFRPSLIGCIIHVFFLREFYSDLLYLIFSRGFTFLRLKRLISFLTKSRYIYLRLLNLRSNWENSDNIIIYSYWFHRSAYAACKLKEYEQKLGKKVYAFSRCHRFDVYENFDDSQYLPLRRFMFEKLDKVFSISNDAIKYFQANYSMVPQDKFALSRLGTIDRGLSKKSNDRIFRIVSCSNCIAVKRVGLILNALYAIKSTKVFWTHFGDGIELPDLKIKAERLQATNPNIHAIFRGQVSNIEILKYYTENPVDLFVNASMSEGIPVSIMEAMSFGIPVIAPDVGGISECILLNSMLLLKSDFSTNDLSNSIISFMGLSDSEIDSIRTQSRKKWEETYDAAINYKLFSDTIQRIFDK